MNFITENDWLRDTVVIDHIIEREGMWEVHLVFAHFRQPQKLINRVIARFASFQKAEANVKHLRQQAAKDQHRMLTINPDTLDLCTN